MIRLGKSLSFVLISLNAKITLEARMRPFISVTALVASSGEVKQTKPNPWDFDLPWS